MTVCFFVIGAEDEQGILEGMITDLATSGDRLKYANRRVTDLNPFTRGNVVSRDKCRLTSARRTVNKLARE